MKLFDRIYDSLPDADDVFAYDTVKEVRVLDRRLGLIYYMVLSMVLFYVVIYVFMIEKQYQEEEKTDGWILSKTLNPPYIKDNDLPFDIFDTTHNPGEQGAMFLPTRVLITRAQENKDTNSAEDYCQSPLHPCTAPSDCDVGNEKLQKSDVCDGYCMRRQWCPAECDGTPDCQTKVLDIDPQEYELRFSTSVHFHKFAIDVSTAEENENIAYPSSKANMYKVRDIIRMANLTLEQVRRNGAILLLNVVFNCDLDAEKCETKLEAANVDSKSGYNYATNHYYKHTDGTNRRDAYRLFGLRLVAFATGIGARRSFTMIVLQVSSAIALLGVAQTAADFFLQHVVPERRHYIEQKIIQTEDFNQD